MVADSNGFGLGVTLVPMAGAWGRLLRKSRLIPSVLRLLVGGQDGARLAGETSDNMDSPATEKGR